MAKLCKDCKHYKFEHVHGTSLCPPMFWARLEEQCHHPYVVDLVNANYVDARVERYSGKAGTCGPTGTRWEPR